MTKEQFAIYLHTLQDHGYAALKNYYFKAGERIKTRFCGLYKLRCGKICEFRVFPSVGEKLA